MRKIWLSYIVLSALVLGVASYPAHVLAQPAPAKRGADAFTEARARMVEEEIHSAGVRDERVLQSMRNTPRHEFVGLPDRKLAYLDMALPIGSGQTISPPFVVAYMTEQLDPQPTDKVLEIGTGSGYQAAVLSPLAKEVYSIEIVEPLGQRAARALKRLKYDNVFTKVGDGYRGWAEHAPFDKIIVTCSPEDVPQPLVDQLAEGGRMVVPLGERYQQTLYLFTKKDGKLVSEALRPTLFVPMTGAAEESRKVLPDPLRPGIVNGSFEDRRAESKDEAVLDGWHYMRRARQADEATAPEGTHFVAFENDVAGQGSQALQGFAVDGRKVHEIDVSFWVRLENVKPGPQTDQLPMLVITFYDERRGITATRGVGPWRGSFDWRKEQERIRVPPQAREAIVRIGLFGATGRADFDDVQIGAADAKASR